MVAVRMFGVVYSKDAIGNSNALAGEGDDAFDDKFVSLAEYEMWIFKDDNLSALWDI